MEHLNFELDHDDREQIGVVTMDALRAILLNEYRRGGLKARQDLERERKVASALAVENVQLAGQLANFEASNWNAIARQVDSLADALDRIRVLAASQPPTKALLRKIIIEVDRVQI